MNKKAIFLCGYPKSGTTLLTALLDGHSQLMVFPEETFFLREVDKHPEITIADSVEWLLHKSNCRNLSLKSYQNTLGEDFDYTHFNFDNFSQQFQTRVNHDVTTHAGVMMALFSAYAEETGQMRKQYWVEKSPLNEYRLQQALSWFPNMRAIYIVRDPRDVYVSYSLKKLRESNQQHDLALEDFMRYWAMSLWAWQQHQISCSRTLLIRFEDLVRFPQEIIMSLCRFLNIEYEPILTRPTKNGRSWSGNSMHGDKFSQISTAPLGRWQEQLDSTKLQVLETFLGHTMGYLGYQRATPPVTMQDAVLVWLKQVKKKRQLFGTLMRLYWPFQLPDFFSRNTSL